MFGERVTDSQIRSSMKTLRGLGVATVEVDFSGGNDEGGVDNVSFLDADGNTVDVPEGVAHRRSYYTGGKRVDKGWQVYERDAEGSWEDKYRDATADEIRWSQLHEVVNHPVYERWGTFAGEFYVDGSLTWDVAAGTYKMSGQESHEVWESFEV